nr:hypothetical protein [Flavobacterium sp. ASV13]
MNQINDILKKLEENKQQRRELFENKGICKELLDMLQQERILKRKLSLLKKQETAVLIENWEYPWNTGAPMPHILSSGDQLFLIYYLAVKDPKWDGSYVNIIDTNSPVTYPIALITFENEIYYTFGTPNDEVIQGHPLYDHGLEACEAHEVIHSSKIDALEKINSIHSCYDPNYWKTLKHYIFTFHDDMFECVSKGYKVEIFNESFKDVVLIATERLFK